MTLNEKIAALKRKQNNFVGEWEEYDKIGEVIDILESSQ